MLRFGAKYRRWVKLNISTMALFLPVLTVRQREYG